MNRLGDLGESGLIGKIKERLNSEADQRVFKGIGDDCAVLRGKDGKKYSLLTTDMLVEGDHFNLDWQTPRQIGWKTVVANVSDIAAMGGLPTWGLLSIAFPEDTTVSFTDELFEGIEAASSEYGLKIVGGDTTHGDNLTINLTILGEVEDDFLSMRGDADVGDMICVSGDLGKSWAGLELLRAGKKGYTDYYLRPECRLKYAREIAPDVNAMIDVSDGLASETTHISVESGLGAEIKKENIPISEKTRRTGERLNKDPLQWALSGGEDFELVFTVPPEKLDLLKDLDPIVVGDMIEEGLYLVDGERKKLKGGYDHFSG